MSFDPDIASGSRRHPGEYNRVMPNPAFRSLAAFTVIAVSAALLPAQTPQITPIPAADRTEAIDIFKQLIEINTTDTSLGNVTNGTTAMQKRFLDAGFPASDVQLLGPDPRKQNLVVRIHGTGGGKPVLFLCHMDVVEALPKDWHTDPFKFIEKDGYYYGRGTQDMKDSDAALVATFLWLHREGYKPKRDLILALTADEEGGEFNGANWLVTNHREMVDAAFVINPDAGGIDLEHSKPVEADVEASEKVYSDFHVMAANRGGHSSLPRPDNAIYELTAALNKLAAYRFPFELNGVTRAYTTEMAKLETGQKAADLRAILATPPDMSAVDRLSADAGWNSVLHTTCVATRLAGGHANNALPQSAEANINCRILPGHPPDEIRQRLISVFADPALKVEIVQVPGAKSSVKPAAPPPPLDEVFVPMRKLVDQLWPGIPVVPEMETGASDSVYFAAVGIPCYGFSAVALEHDDVRAHGQDERIPIDSYDKSVQFFYAYAKTLGSE
jgi:acetylornithine deacetylase/succinyl-diaminopimelate desuccinylase-like protein